MAIPDSLCACAAAPLLAAALAATAAQAADLPEIVVVGQGSYSDRRYTVTSDDVAAGVPDANALMQRIPGGANNDNGAISGQLQYRGLFGPRVNTVVNGVAIHSGGPNWMDPPLHYAPSALLDSFSFSRGIASVSEGIGMGGVGRARLKRARYAGTATAFQGDLSIGGHTVDDGYAAAGLLGFAGASQRGHVMFARDEGDDAESGDGTIDDTEYERDYYGAGYGIRVGSHELTIDYAHVDTDPSGNPVLPLDLNFFDTDIVRGGYAGDVGGVHLELGLHYVDIDHRMDNFTLRPAPDFSALPLPPFVGDDRRFVDVFGESFGLDFAASYPVANGEVRAGFQISMDENDATVRDPDVPAFFVTNFDDAETDVYSAYGEWRGRISDRLKLELGARWIRTENDVNEADAQPAQLADAMPAMCMGAMPPPPPCAVRALRDRFNASDRSRMEDEFDWVVRASYALSGALSTELAFARKTRAPSYVERYLWIPLEVNSGLGDGNNYVGRVDLEPEVAHQVELAFDWRTAGAYVAPRGFYHRVDDYIQGVAVPASAFNMPIIGVSANANGDPTPLAFANVDAELYGVDLLAGAALPMNFRTDVVLSYVRGKRRDVDDDLYRVAPPRLSWAVVYEQPRWFVQLETVFTARQDHISQTITDDPANPNNSNAETAGHVLLNLRGRIRLERGFRLSCGVDNLLDKAYRDHLAGFNRVLGSDAARGLRLPGRGINGYLTLGYAW